MLVDLIHLDCRICGRAIYFPVSEIETEDSSGNFELTCSRGHTDQYFHAQSENVEPLEAPRTEFARAAVVGF